MELRESPRAGEQVSSAGWVVYRNHGNPHPGPGSDSWESVGDKDGDDDGQDFQFSTPASSQFT